MSVAGSSPFATALLVITCLLLATAQFACSPCARAKNAWLDDTREAVLLTGTGVEIMESETSHLIINLPLQAFDEFIAANLDAVDPPDATTDIDFVGEQEEVLGDATVSFQLRPQGIRVTEDEVILLHSQLRAIVQIDMPGRSLTRVLEGSAKTIVELTADPDDPSRTLIASGGLGETSISLPDSIMDEAWSEPFRLSLRETAARLVARSTASVRRAIDVMRLVPPSASLVGLEVRISGIRQPRGSERTLVEVTTNLRAIGEPMRLAPEDLLAGKEQLLVHVHEDLPVAWMRFAMASSTSGYLFDDDGKAVEAPGYMAIPDDLVPLAQDAEHAMFASFDLYRFEASPCQTRSYDLPFTIQPERWRGVDLATMRMVDLERFARRSFIELLFHGSLRVGTREIRWQPTYAPVESSTGWRFAGTFELAEASIEAEIEQDRRGGRPR